MRNKASASRQVATGMLFAELTLDLLQVEHALHEGISFIHYIYMHAHHYLTHSEIAYVDLQTFFLNSDRFPTESGCNTPGWMVWTYDNRATSKMLLNVSTSGVKVGGDLHEIH